MPEPSGPIEKISSLPFLLEPNAIFPFVPGNEANEAWARSAPTTTTPKTTAIIRRIRTPER